MITILLSILITYLMMLAFIDESEIRVMGRGFCGLIAVPLGGMVGFVAAVPIIGLTLLPCSYHETSRQSAYAMTHGFDYGRPYVHLHYKSAHGWPTTRMVWVDEVEWRDGEPALATESYGHKESWYWLLGFDLGPARPRTVLYGPAELHREMVAEAEKAAGVPAEGSLARK